MGVSAMSLGIDKKQQKRRGEGPTMSKKSAKEFKLGVKAARAVLAGGGRLEESIK